MIVTGPKKCQTARRRHNADLPNVPYKYCRGESVIVGLAGGPSSERGNARRTYAEQSSAGETASASLNAVVAGERGPWSSWVTAGEEVVWFMCVREATPVVVWVPQDANEVAGLFNKQRRLLFVRSGRSED